MVSDLAQVKWERFTKRVRWFRYVPFVDFVLASGSLAMGTVKEHSDFDVIVGTRQGRLYTARLFTVVIYSLLGWYNRFNHDDRRKADKICVGHYVTPDGYRLPGPYNAYWQYLYTNLVPVLGDEVKIEEFFAANDWLAPGRKYERHERYMGEGRSVFKKTLEVLLRGRVGDSFERLKTLQKAKLKKWLEASMGYKPKFALDDEVFMMYLDTKRTEEASRELSS